MKAISHTEYGSPDVLKLSVTDKPIPDNKEVLIRVYATTVNRTDCAMLSATPFIMRFFTGLLRPKNTISGTDFAGIVEAVGKDVTTLRIGERVFGFDDSGISSHAEFMTLSEDKAIAGIPDNITFEQAAASIEGAHYAFNMINKVALKSGQKVLVNGASGAIGSSAVQLLSYYGARITAVCNTKNIELVKSLGAERVIDFTKEEFIAASNEKYQFIFDTVGKSSFTKCKPLLNSGGVYISSEPGSMVQNPVLALLTPLAGNKKVVFPIPFNIKKSVLLIKKLFEEGKFQAVIDRTYPLEDIAEAYRYVMTGQKTGSVVIRIGSGNPRV